MARYGTSYYGQSFYGSPLLTAFAAAGFEAVPTSYGTVSLTWTSPGGSWDEMQVVRNYSGYPAAFDNGDVVYSATAGSDAGHYTDAGLITDRWVYYTMFVHDASEDEWFRAGAARVFVPKNYGGAEKMLNLLPDVTHSDALVNFMSIFGYAYDLLRNDINSVLDLYDSRAVSYDLVPLVMGQFGIPVETELEPEQYRRFLRNAAFFYKTKGTLACIHGVVAAVTGWQSTVTTGANIMWTADYSDFAGGIAGWRAKANASVGWTAPTDTVSGALRVTATGTALATAEADVDEWFPVAQHSTYSLSVLARASDLAMANVSIRFDWYDLSKNLISSNEGSLVATRQGVDSVVRATASSPDNAVWLDPVFVVHSPTVGSWWEFRKVMLNRGQPLPYEHGRDIAIYLGITDTDPLRKAVHLDRLSAILPRYLPLGATFTLLDTDPPALYASDDTIITLVAPTPPTAPVGRSLTIEWSVGFYNTALRALRWNVTGHIVKDVSLRWNEKTAVGKNVSLIWNTG